jgi:hydroxymethylpyrimidine/phosphomethylpyrimidine kinase
MPSLLTIAGTDPSSGAGIPVDLQVFRDFGHHGLSVVTAVVSQNTSGVRNFEAVDAPHVRDQLDAVFDDLPVAAVKIGMLPTAEVVETVADVLRERAPDTPTVFDPVLVSGSGDSPLRHSGTEEAMRDSLVPRVDWLTPNVPEAEVLSATEIASRDDATRVAAQLRALGPRSVLLKVGHLSARRDDTTISDLLATDEGVVDLEPLDAIDADVRGTGCQLSSALASSLVDAPDASPPDVAERARRYLNELLHESRRDVGEGRPVIVRD